MAPPLHHRPCLAPPPGIYPKLRTHLLSPHWPSRKSHSSCSGHRLSRISANSSSARYAVLGAGFAGLSVVWHLLKHTVKESRLRIDIYDEVGIGGGASGASGGLLHPYSPKVRVLWRGADCWNECLKLLSAAERALEARSASRATQESFCNSGEPIVCRRGILRPITAEKNVVIMKENAQTFLKECNLELLDGDAAQNLVPGLHIPFNSSIYMPLALNIHPKQYLQALFAACLDLADNASVSECGERELNLFREPIGRLHELAEHYDAVILCCGAKVNMLPELSGKLPLRTCRGVIAQLKLSSDVQEEYGNNSPSILSDAWLAFQGPRSVLMGSTWDWGSKNFSVYVSEEEALSAVEELLPKASAVYPAIREWEFVGARAGLRAMPPMTDLGSLPLLGSVNDAINSRNKCIFWLIGGFGSRGLLYHGFLGKLMAQAVISSDENVLPPELTSWKKMNIWRDNV